MATKENEQTEAAASAAACSTDPSLREKIKTQVEYYMSRENLLQDAYLVRQMDKDHFVDLSVVAEFNKIKQLTSDLDLVLASIKDSDKIVIDEAKRRIKPTTIFLRTTLIIRNIPSDADRDAVETFLVNGKVPKIVNLRADVGNNWFANFETEEAAKAALDAVRALKWNDKSLGAAVKSETGLTLGMSSTQGVPPSALNYYVPMGAGHNGGYEGGQGHYR
eukprot:CAMPEP_0113697578 /NCGR_PEP_ID=MMETSP0038_2-20120614/22213_1 /TAXON_ID=2898 /ORGANISM="Cryptomonas paramecium" /LENGTH=219 /DNA_ID=CAMNT_0000620607 /DNA_START=162 /DNA_END=818 /DNA_ORIENTATION=+ /assembly_acc=CAM_ASM_000170